MSLFQSKTLNQNQLERVQAVRNEFEELLDVLIVLCPDGRELAIARTKLQEACFFAVKAISEGKTNG